MNEPIPVAEAVEAVTAAIEVCKGSEEWEPLCDCRGYHDQCAFIVAARAGYAGALEYLLHGLKQIQAATGQGPLREEATFNGNVPVFFKEYAAVAPIVQWHRAQGGTR